MNKTDKIIQTLLAKPLSGLEFNQIFNQAKLSNLIEIKKAPICENVELSKVLVEYAEDQGYRLQKNVEDINKLTYIGEEVEHLKLQLEAVKAWKKLRACSQSFGYDLKILSAYRGFDYQKRLFFKDVPAEMANLDQFKERLKVCAIPGYSKHHTGYTIDIGSILTDKEIQGRGGSLDKFADSQAYLWISKDNYLQAKIHGFIPSYPPDTPKQGPLPEPWEFIFVGLNNILKFIN